MSAIDRNLQVVEVSVVSTQQRVALHVKQGGRVTEHQLIAHDCSIREHCPVEDTHGFIPTKV